MVRRANQKTLDRMSGYQLMQRRKRLKKEERKAIINYTGEGGPKALDNYSKRRDLISEEIKRTDKAIERINNRLKEKHLKKTKGVSSSLYVVMNRDTFKDIKGTETPNRPTAYTRAGKLNKQAGIGHGERKRYIVRVKSVQRAHM